MTWPEAVREYEEAVSRMDAYSRWREITGLADAAIAALKEMVERYGFAIDAERRRAKKAEAEVEDMRFERDRHFEGRQRAEAEVERIGKVNTLHYQEAQFEHSLRLSVEAEVERLKWMLHQFAAGHYVAYQPQDELKWGPDSEERVMADLAARWEEEHE